MSGSNLKPRRCCIYTRKSSEEGLDQAFNSLHAQRDMCAAYVKSQAGEGWRLEDAHYDDGGHSGATMARPALQRLMADVAARRIDVVVVYKVDRLTRSLGDFARIIEAFDKANVSFVSVTQAFNTTTSMERLTLNVLLSFAQFEREVTGERIRDKIAASKAKGLWMGGVAPLGYDRPAAGAPRVLVVNEVEASKVKLIFRRLLELGSVYPLQLWLDQQAIRSKVRAGPDGQLVGGYRFTRGALDHLLRNRIYLGEIPHKETSYPGRHPAIIDKASFDAVQAILNANSRTRRERVPKAQALMLAGKVFDAAGEPMAPRIDRTSEGREYSYYVGLPAMPGDGDDDAIRRVPAHAIEGLVKGRLGALAPAVSQYDLPDFCRAVVARVEVHAASVHIVLSLRQLSTVAQERIGLDRVRNRIALGDQLMSDPTRPGHVRIVLPVRLKVRGGRTWADGPGGRGVFQPTPADRSAIRRLRKAHLILQDCGFDPAQPSAQMRMVRGPKYAHHTHLAEWAFLAPDIQRDILTGRIGTDALAALRSLGEVPLCWEDQRALVRPNAPPRRRQVSSSLIKNRRKDDSLAHAQSWGKLSLQPSKPSVETDAD